MREVSVAIVLAAHLSAGAPLAIGQEKSTAGQRGPKKGDTITVKGCLSGSMLLSTETTATGGAELPIAAYTYQLKGKKDLLKELRAKHDATLVELTGELKSTLPEESFLGTRIGRTTIVVGADPRSREQGMQGTAQPLPVLEVRSYEGSSVACQR
jgi:hypothetical protein